MANKYQRILLKLSGEQLAGRFEGGVDPEVMGYFADEVKQAVDAGCQVVVIAGGGNMVRGAEIARRPHGHAQRADKLYGSDRHL